MYFKFRNPKKVDIVILDNECDSLLLDYIIKNEFSYKIVESKIEKKLKTKE